MTEELLPCPFCGGEVELFQDDVYGTWVEHKIKHIDGKKNPCILTCKQIPYYAEREKTWNTRTTPQVNADWEKVEKEFDREFPPAWNFGEYDENLTREEVKSFIRSHIRPTLTEEEIYNIIADNAKSFFMVHGVEEVFTETPARKTAKALSKAMTNPKEKQ